MHVHSGVESRIVPTLLCIDDHKPTLQTLCWLFEANGYQCLQAANAADGNKLFRENKVDLVIVDHTLQTEDGSTLAARFKQVRNVPILMLSGWADLEKPKGIDVLLIKPQEPQTLIATVLGLIVRAQSAAGGSR